MAESAPTSLCPGGRKDQFGFDYFKHHAIETRQGAVFDHFLSYFTVFVFFPIQMEFVFGDVFVIRELCLIAVALPRPPMVVSALFDRFVLLSGHCNLLLERRS